MVETAQLSTAVKLQEPVRLRDFDAIEDRKLSEFQGEMVQLAACLRGDHDKDTYPDMLVEGMNVAQASEYCNESFNIFLQECEKANNLGADQDDVVMVTAKSIECSDDQQEISTNDLVHKSFFQKLFSCLV